MWNDAVTSLSSLQTDMHNASTLIRQTRSNRKSVQKEKLQMEFVTACNTVAADMEARFGTTDHDVIAQGLQALVSGSYTLLDFVSRRKNLS